MANRLPRLHKMLFGASTLTLLTLPLSAMAQTPSATQEQSAATQDRPTDRQDAQTDDITRRDLARFDQFLDSHREDAQQLRKTPSLVDDPQFLQNHPALNSYLQDHPSVKQEISQQPDTFMRLEDRYNRDANLRDRDAGGQDRDADHRDADNDRDRGQDRGGERRDLASFNHFLDDHREIAEQVRRNPSLVDDQQFVQSHPALQTYLQDNPGVRDQLRQDPNAFMHREDAIDRDNNMRDRDQDGQGRDSDRREVVNFSRFLDSHREIAEQVRKDPSLVDNRTFVENHPVLQAYLQENPGVRDQLRQDPNAFMRQEDVLAHNEHQRDNDPMRMHMADFGGFLGNHSDIQNDLSRDPSKVTDHDYVQHHAELNTYLNAHPDVRAELMANPQGFVQGAQQFSNNNAGGAGMNGRGAGTTTTTAGSSAGTAATRPTSTPKPNQ
ncbi:MAG TPA: hypothetical protein VK716_07680 [Terracidiphilus sp.]|jgi:hypothetical protein|nr:hypothetical protein [Terracidiphilus sp.]